MVEKGLLGPIKAYFGTVENQGRGSLHLHMLMWLDHELTPAQLKESVQNEEFRNGLLSYLEDIIKQDLSNFDYNTSNTNGTITFLRAISTVSLLTPLWSYLEYNPPTELISIDELMDIENESKQHIRET